MFYLGFVFGRVVDGQDFILRFCFMINILEYFDLGVWVGITIFFALD